VHNSPTKVRVSTDSWRYYHFNIASLPLVSWFQRYKSTLKMPPKLFCILPLDLWTISNRCCSINKIFVHHLLRQKVSLLMVKKSWLDDPEVHKPDRHQILATVFWVMFNTSSNCRQNSSIISRVTLAIS